MDTFLKATVIVGTSELALAILLTLLPRAGRPGRSLAGACTRAPLLDLVVALLTWLPWLAAGLAAGWPGVGGAIVGQIGAALLWVWGHEQAHREAARGPRLRKAHHRIVGRWRNGAALWFSVLALTPLWVVRIGELLLYPPLRWLLGFPPYRHGDWINVSRQKFDGLVGHDLIWCLYCDWMTGVYALGGEMLRNVESFWCPIRFYNGKKCENCRIDFPDIDAGWVPADGTMADVERTVLQNYGNGRREWFGHPARLTVDGVPTDRPAASREPD
ncbi:MAG: hypothetical protein ACYS0G_10560 [Planctomycetota bacterium]|jgi:hypothetical protein